MNTIPEGYHSLTPYIVVRDAAGAIELYRKALGAAEDSRMSLPNSDKIMHACLQIGSSKLFLCDENPEQGMPAPKDANSGSKFYLYVDDVDAQHKQAIAAGMTEVSAPMDMFWGDRMSVLTDPYGHTWDLATHIRDVSEEEMTAAMSQM